MNDVSQQQQPVKVNQAYGIGIAGLVISVVAIVITLVAGGMFWYDSDVTTN